MLSSPVPSTFCTCDMTAPIRFCFGRLLEAPIPQPFVGQAADHDDRHHDRRKPGGGRVGDPQPRRQFAERFDPQLERPQMKSSAPVSASSAMANRKLRTWQPRKAMTPTTSCVSDQVVRSELLSGRDAAARRCFRRRRPPTVAITIQAQRGSSLQPDLGVRRSGCRCGLLLRRRRRFPSRGRPRRTGPGSRTSRSGGRRRRRRISSALRTFRSTGRSSRPPVRSRRCPDRRASTAIADSSSSGVSVFMFRPRSTGEWGCPRPCPKIVCRCRQRWPSGRAVVRECGRPAGPIAPVGPGDGIIAFPAATVYNHTKSRSAAGSLPRAALGPPSSLDIQSAWTNRTLLPAAPIRRGHAAPAQPAAAPSASVADDPLVGRRAGVSDDRGRGAVPGRASSSTRCGSTS